MSYGSGWKAPRGERIDPFTVRYAASRCLLSYEAVARTGSEQVWAILDAFLRGRLTRQYPY